jgi:hypothetical protein
MGAMRYALAYHFLTLGEYMSTITITLKTNDAFYRVGPDGFCHELPDILESLAQYIRDENAFPDAINDSNGCTVGSIIETA